jgi:hypothetical protein
MTEEQTKRTDKGTGAQEQPEQNEPTDSTETTDQEQGGDDLGKVRREAAGYRRKLRDTEAERDQLAARLTDYDRAEVERQVTEQGGLQNAADFWLAVQLDELRDDVGALDPEKVKAARERVLPERPHWRQPSPSFDGGAREPVRKGGPNFGEAIKRAAG